MWSRFPEACVSGRNPEFSVPYSRFPEACWTEQHPEFLLLSSQVHTWEYLALPGLFGLLELSCPTDTPCRETRQHAFAFAISKPCEELSWDLFDISDCYLAERKDACWKSGCRKNMVSFMMLKRCNKLCHSLRVKLPFVRMSASWFWDSTYSIWIFASKFILSNNQSRATLWVRDTCLVVGLLPLTIIFITASLSSKMYNCDSFTGEMCLRRNLIYAR